MAKKRMSKFRVLLSWKKKHEKHGYLNHKDGLILQKMATDAYMEGLVNEKQYESLISKTIVSGRTFTQIMDKIKDSRKIWDSAFKTYAQQRR